MEGNLSYIESYNHSRIHTEPQDYLEENENAQNNLNEKKFYLETYGCQMNENDSEIISTILEKNNFVKTNVIEDVLYI